MRVLIIICMIISLLIMPWSVVYGAAGAIMGVTGAVAALMQAYGYVTSVTGDTYDAQDVSVGIGDMMEAYASHLGTTVAALFPASSILFTAGSTVLKYSTDIVDAVQGMIEYYSDGGVMDYVADSGGIISIGPGQAYRLPYRFTSSNYAYVQVEYIGDASSDDIYVTFNRNPSGGDSIEIDDMSNTGGIIRYTWMTTNGAVSSYDYTMEGAAWGTQTNYKSYKFSYTAWWGDITSDVYFFTSGWSPPHVLAQYYYTGQVSETYRSITITGSDALPDTAEDTSLMIPGIGTAGTLDAAGEQILDLVVEGALDIVTQLPEGDPISPDLFDVFPFCLPYDMYRLLHVFDAEPQAPVIHWPIKIDSMGISQELVVDLSEWDSVATLLRHLETIVFLVGLALITRKWIGAE